MNPYGFNYGGFGGGFSFNPPPPPEPAPEAMPQPLSQHQLNSYKTLLDMSSPQERQQMLQQLQKAAGNNPAAAQLHQTFQGYNTGQQQQNVYHNDLGTNAYQLGSNLIQGGLDMFIPNQSAGDVTGPNAQFDAQGRLLNPQQSLQGGHAASQLDVARQGIADRFFTKGVTEGMPGLAGTGAGVTEGANVLQAGLQRGLQMAPGFMAGNLATSFNGDGTQLTPYQQAVKSGESTLAGAGQALGFGVGGELVGAAGRGIVGGAARGIESGVNKVFPGLNTVHAVEGATPAEGGYIQITPPHEDNFDWNNPSHLNDYLDEIDRNISSLPDELNARRQQIQQATNIPTGQKNKLLQAESNNLAQAGRELQQEKALTLQHLQEIGGQRNAAPTDIPQGAAGTTGQERLAAEQEAAKPLAYKVGKFARQVTDQFEGPTRKLNPLDILKDQSGSINLEAKIGGEEAKPLGEQIGRLKAAIAKETDPNTKAELTAQLKQLNKQFAAQKRVSQAQMKSDFESVMGEGTAKPTETPAPEGIPAENAVKDAQATQAKEDQATAEAIARQRQAPEPYKGLKQPKSWQDVRDNGYSAGKLSTDNTEAIARQADEIFGKKADKKRLYLVMDSIEHPEDLGANAAKLKISPETLQSFIAKFKTATDFTHSLRSGFGEAINYRNLYALHPWDLHNEDVKAALGELQKSQGGAFHGSAALERIWPTLRDGPSSFALKKLSVGDAIREWGKEERTAVQAAALKQSILKKDPHGFVDFSNEGQPRTPDGKPYKVSGVPGLSGWLTPEAYHATQGFRILDMDSMGKGMKALVKGLDALNRLGKGVELLGGAFHDLNTSLRYTAQELASAISPRSPLRPFRAVIHTWDMNRAFWDDGYYNHLVSKLHSDGWLDLLAKTHLTGTQATDATLLGSLKTGSIEKLNPYSKALFERKIDLMKKLSAIEEAKSMGITDPKNATAKQIDQLRGASDAINNRYGGLNLQTLNRNPIVQLVFRQVGLAPDFWEGKFRTDAAAANFFNPLNRSAEGRAKSSLALRQIIGTTILIGAISELTRQAMGQGSKNIQQAYNNDIKAPSVPLPFTNKQGQKIIGNLPATDVSEITRAFMDPGHYLTARLSAGVSLGAELATGKDYYGNTLTDLNRNPNPSVLTNLEGALKSRLTIPGNQAMSMNNPNSTTNWPVALTNMLGLRVARDPNDPQYQQVQQYFQAYQKASQGLTPNQLHDFNELFPAKKDSQGNYLPDSKFDPFSSSVKSSILLKSAAGDGVVLNRMEQMNQALGQHDPMWDVNNTVGQGTINGQNYPALNVFLKYQQFKADDPGSIAAKEIVANNPWITDLEKARTDYFNTPQMQSAFAKANAANPNAQNPIQYPNIDPQTQQLMTVAESIKDPAQKSQFINANPSLQQAYQQLGNYTSQRQAQVMAPQFAQAPTPSPAVQAALNAKQYNAPGVQQYLNQEAAFKIAGPYGDGIGGAGGGRNTSPQAIANVSQGLQPNGKPSPYAQYAARSSASAARRSVRNAMKNENKQMKYAIKHSNKNIQRVSFKPNSSLEKALAKTKRKNPIA